MTTLAVGEAIAKGLTLPDFDDAEILAANSTTISLRSGAYVMTINGDFHYTGDGYLTTEGYTSGIYVTYNGQTVLDISDFRVPNTTLALDATDLDALVLSLFTGNDNITGSSYADDMSGVAGLGADTVSGGAGDDVIDGGSGANYLRGDDGNDILVGGADFDDVNGNRGGDSASGGAGGDWVAGGKDNDLLHGESGDDIVYGNLGNDTCYGDVDNDVVRGGKDDDIVDGGGGNDWLSGDMGDDTVTGGTGADVFHTFGAANLDRVTDFNRAEGDRVMLDPGTVYTLAQVGSDTVISMDGGGQMILVGVAMGSLTGDWIFGA